MLNAAISYTRDHRQQFVDNLISLVKIPSISANLEYLEDVKAAADWNLERLRELGFEDIEVFPVGDHQIVFGRFQGLVDTPTILVYGHYDVTAVDSIDEWDSDPFDPQIRGNYIYARGTSDMKAQLIAFYSAIEALTKAGMEPPNIKFLLDGAEEIGSPGLDDFIKDNQERLACDFCLDIDSGIFSTNQPSITYALRGLAYFELFVQGPDTDLHSGSFGGPIDNPAIVLCELIAGMRDETGRITLPGFYDSVLPISVDERQELATLPTTNDWWKEQTGVRELRSENGFSATELATARPTLNVNGIMSGHVQNNQNTVIPADAKAKISMRLVPQQTPEEVCRSLETYLSEKAPETVTWMLKQLTGCRPAFMNRDTSEMDAASQALKGVWGTDPIFIREGGSVPIHGLVQEHLGVQSMSLGFMLPDDNIHASNERQYLPNFYKGIETYIRFLHLVGRNKHRHEILHV